MASTPAFAATVNVGDGLVPATADTSRTAPTHTTTVFTAGANGSKVEQIIYQGVGTTVAGGISVFRYDGSNYWLIDEIEVTAVTPSTTVAPYQLVKPYSNFFLKSGDTLRVTCQIAGNESLVNVHVAGGDY